MAEEKQKKMSVAEILAAARKADSKGGAAALESADDGDGATKPAPEAAKPAASEASEKPKPAPAKPAAAAGGKRPSTADILAMARSGDKAKAAERTEPAAKPKPAPKPAAEKAAPKKPAAATSSGPKDTASILAAARKEHRPGPMTKQQAAEQGKKLPESKPKPAGERAVKVPPMPQRPDFAKARAEKAAAVEDRRGFFSLILGSALGLGFTSLAVTSGLWTLGFARFMFPNVLIEPPSRFKVGFPGDFPPGEVSDRFKAQFGLWVINGEYEGQRQIYALRTVCTHLGCTPNWLESEQKFKCPCHGSGFYKDGINFEGPAPRPLERYAIRLADDGQLEVDKSRLFQEEMGQWEDPASFVTV